ncbi:MAG: ethanolamine ammonia-lyase subunit EutB, partial [Myxococcales bacterium]|nr:ethanolamine ammonia-lyase subunit EutB [Myxococcales bacterium]
MLTLTLGGAALLPGCGDDPPVEAPEGVELHDVREGEDVFAYIERKAGGFDQVLYQQIIGAANELKEGDALIGVAAIDEQSRTNARMLLSNTRVGDLAAHSLHEDAVQQLIDGRVDPQAAATTADWTMGELRDFLLSATEDEIKGIRGGMSSDVIGCVVKLLSNDELVVVGANVFNPLPGSQIGARGYLGARIQPNSPTDDLDDIRWQVFDAFAYAVGDVVLGTNPVSSELDSIAAVEGALRDIVETFGLQDVIPHCVLAHIDLQAEVEAQEPGATALWFQSLGGTETANDTFDLTVQKMLDHAAQRTGKYGLYFETGQGADATNGHDWGFDMVVHESRKYGFARALAQDVAAAQAGAGRPVAPWVHLNDVAGFIGPEVFRTREQLVRCCLEDIVMGKLHGLCIGLDICSTLHMEVSLTDLDWCIEQIMPANPAYLMGLPTKNDPMLSYLTTAYQDHVRVRDRFGYKVNDAMWQFFQELGVIDAQGNPTARFGQPTQVYLEYQRRKGDMRTDQEILDEGATQIGQVRDRGVWIAEGYGEQPWDLEPSLAQEITRLYEDAKRSIWAELDEGFVTAIPDQVWLATGSADRDDYIGHPSSGERLSDEAVAEIERLRGEYDGRYDVQIVISDGLNAYAIMDDGHAMPFLEELRGQLEAAGYAVAPTPVVLTSGRVRAGYHLGEVLFGGQGTTRRGIIHVIGERPGSGHHNFSAYITAPPIDLWAKEGVVDHDITRVVSGISDTALAPGLAAADAVQ